MPLGEEKIVPFCAIRCWFKSWKKNMGHKKDPFFGGVFWKKKVKFKGFED